MAEEEKPIEPVVSPDVTPQLSEPVTSSFKSDRRTKRFILPVLILIIVVAVLVGLAAGHKSTKTTSNTSKSSTASQKQSTAKSSSSSGTKATAGQTSQTTGPATAAPLAAGEQLTKSPATRPAQYTNVCSDNTSGIIYITQGDPQCLANGTFQQSSEDEDSSFPDSQYNFACQTNSGATSRYVYITNGDDCPTGSVAVN